MHKNCLTGGLLSPFKMPFLFQTIANKESCTVYEPFCHLFSNVV